LHATGRSPRYRGSIWESQKESHNCAWATVPRRLGPVCDGLAQGMSGRLPLPNSRWDRERGSGKRNWICSDSARSSSVGAIPSRRVSTTTARGSLISHPAPFGDGDTSANIAAPPGLSIQNVNTGEVSAETSSSQHDGFPVYTWPLRFSPIKSFTAAELVASDASQRDSRVAAINHRCRTSRRRRCHRASFCQWALDQLATAPHAHDDQLSKHPTPPVASAGLGQSSNHPQIPVPKQLHCGRCD
jgi:hypothetical protein